MQRIKSNNNNNKHILINIATGAFKEKNRKFKFEIKYAAKSQWDLEYHHIFAT
jgi:hypothetical protein